MPDVGTATSAKIALKRNLAELQKIVACQAGSTQNDWKSDAFMPVFLPSQLCDVQVLTQGNHSLLPSTTSLGVNNASRCRADSLHNKGAKSKPLACHMHTAKATAG